MIRVVTDSTANLPTETLNEYPTISVIPSYVTFRNETLRESLDLSTTEFYERLAADKQLPTTNQASVQDFETFYRKLIADHMGDSIISIHISGALSGTVESARRAAAKFPHDNIQVFDSRAISLGHGLMVRQAAYMARVGFSVSEILAQLASMSAGMHAYFILDTLDYLLKGGRIGVAARMLGTALDIKPVLTLRDGNVTPFENHRTRARAIEAMRDKVLNDGRGKHGLQLAVLHAVCKDEAQQLADGLREELVPDVMLLGEIGPAVGVYAGPGALGMCWWSPEQ